MPCVMLLCHEVNIRSRYELYTSCLREQQKHLNMNKQMYTKRIKGKIEFRKLYSLKISLEPNVKVI